MTNRNKSYDNKPIGTPLYFCERVNGSDFDEKTYMLDRILLIKMVRGSVKVEINGKQFVLSSQHFAFLPPHSSVHVVKCSYDMEAVVVGFMMALQEVVLQKLGHAFFVYAFRKMVWQLTPEGDKTLTAFCTMFEQHCRKPVDAYSGDIANSLFNAFLLSFYQAVKDKFEDTDVTSATNKSIAAKFAFLLHENFKQKHTVSFYADKLCISSKYLTQVIKNSTGFTPKTAIDHSLGIEALFLLGNTSLNVQEISNKLGFPDQSYFGRFFKRLFGLSPMQFRAKPDLHLLERLREANRPLENLNK